MPPAASSPLALRGWRSPAGQFTLAALLILAIALAGRVGLLASGAVSFHSDEAVVGLMARHILQGERPVFFYGQAYMGSLDAWLVAIGFAVLGDSVLTIRVVQAILYLLIVATGMIAAYKLTGRRGAALGAGLLLAVPNTLVALYTTATLGGYNETLLIGNLILILAADAARDARAGVAPRAGPFAAIGGLAGVGWWANGLIVITVLPAALVVLAAIAQGRRYLGRYAAITVIAGVAFIVGSAPWWAFNLENDWAALRFYLPGGTPEAFAGGDVPSLSFDQQMIGLFLLGLPAVIGLRYPWAATYLTQPPLLAGLAMAVLLIALLAVYRLARHQGSATRDGRTMLLLTFAFCIVVFSTSRFSTDPTGRYFLPLAVTLAVTIGAMAASLPRAASLAVMAVMIAFNAAGLAAAVAANPPGVTTQFNLDTHLPNDDDAALIVFLEENDLYRGYTHYWVAYRLAFLSHESLIYRAVLPYKRDLGYTPRDERYAPYVEIVEAARQRGDRLAYVIGDLPEVRAFTEAHFASQEVGYATAQVGQYTVYYDFTPSAPLPPSMAR